MSDFEFDPWATEDPYREDWGEEGGEESEYYDQPEAQYTYHTALDERVCGRCAPLEGVIFSESEIPEWFPAADNYEDVIFVNVHDRCRCQLTREPELTEPAGEEEGEGDMVEGRGIPLRRITSLGFAARNPRSLGRFGLRQALMFLGVPGTFAFIVPFLVQTIAQQVMNMIQQNQRFWQQQQRIREAEQFRQQFNVLIQNNRLDEAATLRLKYMANLASGP